MMMVAEDQVVSTLKRRCMSMCARELHSFNFQFLTIESLLATCSWRCVQIERQRRTQVRVGIKRHRFDINVL